MMTTPSIDLEVSVSVPEGILVSTPVEGGDADRSVSRASVQSEPENVTVDQLQVALARPLADNSAIQRELENVIRQLAQTSFVAPQGVQPAGGEKGTEDTVAHMETGVTRQPAASTVPVVEPPTVVVPTAEVVPLASARRVEVPLSSSVAVDMPRQAAASTVPVVQPSAVVVPSVTVVPTASAPLVDASVHRVETPLASSVTVDMTRQAAASTVPVVEPSAVVVPSATEVPSASAPLVDASARRVETPPASSVTVDMTRQAAASTGPIAEPPAMVTPMADVVPREGTPLVNVSARRVEGRSVFDEVDPGDAAVAAGVRPVVEGMMPVAPQEVTATSDVVMAVDAVRMAFAPAEVPLTETFLEAANAVADVLLVTPGLLRGEGEIRVQLRPDVLEGSNVQISVVGRDLAIEFIPQTSDVAVLIEQNRPQLEQHLAARFQTFRLSVGVSRRRGDDMKGGAV